MFCIIIPYSSTFFNSSPPPIPMFYMFEVQIPVVAYTVFGLKRRSFLFVIDKRPGTSHEVPGLLLYPLANLSRKRCRFVIPREAASRAERVTLSMPSRRTQKGRTKLRRVCLFLCKTRVSYERSRSFTYKISLMIDDRLFMHHPEKMMFS